MKEQFQKSQFPDWRETLTCSIRKTMEQSLSEAEHDALTERQKRFSNLPRREWTVPEMTAYLYIEEQLEKSRIRVQTLTEFRFVLEQFGYKGGELSETLAHENAHANVAETVNAIFAGYILDISHAVKEGRAAYVVQPATDVRMPEAWNEAARYETAIRIVQAPETYGGELYDEDRAELERLFLLVSSP